MGNQNQNYVMSSVEEFFSAMEETNTNETKLVAKSLVKYIRNKKLAA